MPENGYFFWNDVLWTLIGAGVFQLIWKISPKRFTAVAAKNGLYKRK